MKSEPSINKIREIRLYRPGDEAGIIRLFKEAFGREMSLDEWRWKYTGTGNKKVWSTVAVTEKDEIVAHYGGMPQRMIYEGREIKGISIGDVMVHPKYRALNIFRQVVALLPEETSKEGFVEGYGFPGERELRLALLLGLYEKVEDVFEASKEVALNNNAGRLRYKLFPMGFDDRRIDDLWESVKGSLKLAVIRDREYFDWRFRRHTLFTYEIWGLKGRFGRRLQALAVLKRDNERLLIVDFVCASENMGVLFQKTENYAYSIGSKRLVLWIPEYLRQSLSGMGFSIGPAGTSIPRPNDNKWLPLEAIKGKFFYTMGDTDFL